MVGQRKLYLSKKLLLSSSTLRTDLLHLTHPVVPMMHIPESITYPQSSVSEVQPEFFKEFERTLQAKILKQHSPKQVQVPMIEAPQILKSKLKTASDAHLRLLKLLSYEDPFRLDDRFIELFLQKEFRQKDIHSIYKNNLSDDMLLKLGTFYTSQKNFHRAADIYLFLYQQKASKIVDQFNQGILGTLSRDCDLYPGFFSIMKHLYIASGTSIGNFRAIYDFINAKNSLQLHKFPTKSFLEVLQTVQLQAVIEATDNVLKLPSVYLETRFHAVNMTIVMKLLEQGHIDQAFSLISSQELHTVNGLFYRLLKAKVKGKQYQTRLLELMATMTNYSFTEIDFIHWRKFTKDHDFHIKSLQMLQANEAIFSFKSQYLVKLLKENKMKKSIHFVISNLDSIHLLDIKPLSIVLLHSHNLDLYYKVLKILPEDKKDELLKICITRTIFDKTISPKKKLDNLRQTLNGMSLNETNAEILSVFLGRFSKPVGVIELFKVMSLRSDDSLFMIIRALKPKVAIDLSIFLFKRKRVHIQQFSRFMVDNFSTVQTIHTLSCLASHELFKALHISLTNDLLVDGKIEKCSLIHESVPVTVSKSVELLLEAKILSKNYETIDLHAYRLNEIQELYLSTLIRLTNLEDVSMTKGFKSNLSRLFKSGLINNQVLSIELLRNLVIKIRERTQGNTLIETERLTYFIENCRRNGVDSESIQSLLQA
jgi:hypothetical protein